MAQFQCPGGNVNPSNSGRGLTIHSTTFVFSTKFIKMFRFLQQYKVRLNVILLFFIPVLKFNNSILTGQNYLLEVCIDRSCRQCPLNSHLIRKLQNTKSHVTCSYKYKRRIVMICQNNTPKCLKKIIRLFLMDTKS